MLLWRESRALGGVLVGAELIFEGGEGSVSMCCLLGKKQPLMILLQGR